MAVTSDSSLVSRLVNLLPEIWYMTPDPDRAEISTIMSGLPLAPNSSDVEGAMQSLVRVQFAYKSVQERERESLANHVSVSTRRTSAEA